jgi:hypothetical protein
MGAVERSHLSCADAGADATTVSIDAAANPFAMSKLAKILDTVASSVRTRTP